MLPRVAWLLALAPPAFACFAACGGSDGGSTTAADAGDAALPIDSGADVRPPPVDAGDGGTDDGGATCPVLPIRGVGSFPFSWLASLTTNDIVSAGVDGAGSVYAIATDLSNLSATVLKDDPTGFLLWGKTLAGVKSDAGSNSHVVARRLILRGTGAVVVGTFDGAVDFAGDVRTVPNRGAALFAMLLTGDGATTWLDVLPGAVTVTGATVDAAGNVWIAGTLPGFATSPKVDFGGGALAQYGDDDLFVLALDAAGKHVFSASFGSSGKDTSAGVAARSAGGVVLAGSLASAGGTLGSGAIPQAGTFIAGYTAVGAHDWTTLPLAGAPRDLATDTLGNAFVTGTTAKGSFVQRVGPLGEPGYTTPLDGIADFGRIAVGPSSVVAVGGALLKPSGTVTLGPLTVDVPPVAGASSGGFPAVVARLDPTGAPVSARVFGGGCALYSADFGLQDSMVGAVAFGVSGRLVVGASVAGNVDLGLGPSLQPARAATLLVTP